MSRCHPYQRPMLAAVRLLRRRLRKAGKDRFVDGATAVLMWGMVPKRQSGVWSVDYVLSLDTNRRGVIGFYLNGFPQSVRSNYHNRPCPTAWKVLEQFAGWWGLLGESVRLEALRGPPTRPRSDVTAGMME